MIYKKLFSQSVLNLLNTGVTFGITYLVIEKFSVSLLGELYLLLSLISIVLLVNVFLPPSFSCLRLQDKKAFLPILLSYYFYVQLPIVFFVLILSFFFNFPLYTSFFIALYAISLSFTNLADILLQAQARLAVFYRFQILISLLKLLALVFFASESWKIDELLILYAIIQLFCVFPLVYYALLNYKGIKRLLNPFKIFRYLFLAQPIIRHYYLSSGLKKLNDNLPALLFSPFVSMEVLGLFSLYQKCLIFGVSFLRSLEALLLNRKFNKYFKTNALYIIAPLCQALVIVGGIIYFYFTVGVDISKLIMFSFLIYPLTITIFLRAKFLSIFNAKPLNIAMIVSISSFILYCLLFEVSTIEFTLTSYGLLLTMQSFVLSVLYFFTVKINRD